jgi:hypothetical protein
MIDAHSTWVDTAGVPVVLCDAEAAVSDLPHLFEALIRGAVVEPIVTDLGSHDPLQAMRAPGREPSAGNSAARDHYRHYMPECSIRLTLPVLTVLKRCIE